MYSESNIDRLPLVFRSNEGKNYFQFHLNGQLASLEYRMAGKGRMTLVRLEVSKYLDQPAVGNALIERVLKYAHRANFKIEGICPRVSSYLQLNPKYQKLLASDSQSITHNNVKFSKKMVI